MALPKLIIDCDTGTDDAVALTALLLCEKYEVLGITCAHGNQPVESTTDNTLRLVHFLGRDVPVYKGCACALTRTLTPGRACNTLLQRTAAAENGVPVQIHEKTLPLPPAVRPAAAQHACSFLVDTLRAAQEPVDIAATAPLTNLAVALRMAPEIARSIGTLYIMGGALQGGNRTPAAEANFYDDPEAAAIVLQCGCRIVLGPLEANRAGATYTLADIAALEAAGTRTAVFLAQELRAFIHRCHLLFGASETECCIHDYAAVAPMIDPQTVRCVRREVCRVDFAGGMADGQLVVDRRGFGARESSVEIVYDMDSARVHALLLALVKRAP